MNDPGSSGIGRIGLGVANVSFAGIHQLGLAITIDVSQDSDFTLDSFDHRVLVPAASLSFWINVQLNTGPASEHDRDDVGPAVSGKVGGKLHRVIGSKLSSWT